MPDMRRKRGQAMSDDLIRRSDAIKAIWGDDINPSEDGMVFEAQSHIDRDMRLISSTDRPSATEIMNAYHEGVRKGIAEAYETYGADRPQEWIPCSERLPAKAGHYLCSFKKPNRIDNIYVDLAYWTGGRWYGYLANEINAWMPLPEPWKGADDDKAACKRRGDKR